MGTFMEYVRTFLVGGAICAVGQLLIDFTKMTPARILVTFVVAGVVLGAVGWYQPLVDYAGAGASVPLLGFGNTIAKGTLDAIREKGFMGVLSGGLAETAAGITAAMVCGLGVALVFKPKAKS